MNSDVLSHTRLWNFCLFYIRSKKTDILCSIFYEAQFRRTQKVMIIYEGFMWEKVVFVCKLFVKILDIYVRGSSFLYKHSLKMNFSITEFFSKCGQIRSFLRIWTHLLLKVNNANIEKVWNMFRINSKDASTTLMAYGYSVWIVDIKHISLLFLVFLLFILNRENLVAYTSNLSWDGFHSECFMGIISHFFSLN